MFLTDDKRVYVRVADLHADAGRAGPGEDEAVRRLASSIHLYGLLTPLEVAARPEGGFRVLHGRRRLRALRLLGVERAEVEQSAVTSGGRP